jgi:NitT/TauT family transport system substrate-binding protein
MLRTLSASFATLCALVATASASNVKVSIGYATAADYLPAFVSKENGCFAANGIDAQFTRIPVTTNMPAAVIADTLQIGAQTATLFLPAVENGLELVAVAGGTRLLAGNETISLVTSTKFQVKRASDVVGKKIGVPGVNSVADVMFRKWLKNEGVDAAKVQIIETPFPQMKDLIKSGQIDGALAVEPIRSMIVNEGVGQRAGVEYHTAVAKDSILAFWTAEEMGGQEPAGDRRLPQVPDRRHRLDRRQSRSRPRDREAVPRVQHAGAAGLERRDQERGLCAVR